MTVFSVETKRGIELLTEAMNLVRYGYDDGFLNSKKHREASFGEHREALLDSLLRNPAYNGQSRSELKNTSHDVSRPNDIEDLCDTAGKLIEPGGQSYMFYSAA